MPKKYLMIRTGENPTLGSSIENVKKLAYGPDPVRVMDRLRPYSIYTVRQLDSEDLEENEISFGLKLVENFQGVGYGVNNDEPFHFDLTGYARRLPKA